MWQRQQALLNNPIIGSGRKSRIGRRFLHASTWPGQVSLLTSFSAFSTPPLRTLENIRSSHFINRIATLPCFRLCVEYQRTVLFSQRTQRRRRERRNERIEPADDEIWSSRGVLFKIDRAIVANHVPASHARETARRVLLFGRSEIEKRNS
jgi:hypothetical protein